MKDIDSERFFNFLEGCGDTYGKEIKPAQAIIFFNALAEFSFAEVEQSFCDHIKKSRFFPTPADIIGNIPKASMATHIGADEAWTIALRSMDEAQTVVLTDEIMQARSIAWDVWNDGDKVGARMAFKSAYERLVLNSPAPKWKVSLGHDSRLREEAIKKAVTQGLLPRSELVKLGYEKEQVIKQNVYQLR
jgi:hypothetical protein